jgi:hypothetical protein
MEPHRLSSRREVRQTSGVDEYEDPDVDPGWRLTPGVLLSFLLPIPVPLGPRPSDALALTRQLWQSFATALVYFGVVLAFIGGDADGASAAPWIVGVALAMAVGMGAQRLVLARPLPCETAGALLGALRTRFFVAIASVEGAT